jgi:UDP-glucuronate decarboxylase
MESGEKKNVLVTGGAGFLGSFLCEQLLKDGNRVICIDNFSTGHVRNIEPYLRNPDFQFLRLDINEPIDLESFPELEAFKIPFIGVQDIYHLAVPTTIKKFEEFRAQTLLANSVGTRNILDVAVKYKSKILLASSSVVYGPRTEELFFSEEHKGVVDQLSPRACYDEGKRFSETMFSTYADVYGLDTRIARIFRSYGPRMALFDGQQISDMILAALNNEKLIISGHEDFSTSLLYVTDVIDGMMRVMKSAKGIGPVNIGSDGDLKMSEIANKIIELTSSSSTVEFGESLLFFSQLGLPNISKAKEHLGWLPVMRLEGGLQKTIDYIRANKILLTGGE